LDRLTDHLDACDFLAWDLELDLVVTTWQVMRWWRLSRAVLEERGFVLVTQKVKPTKGARQFVDVTFVMLDERFREHSAFALMHLAGTAEVRNALGVGCVLPGGPQVWSSTAWREAATLVPDALWQRPDGSRIAIEYDSTHYDNGRVLLKAEEFSRFDGQVWGAPTPRRVADLTTRVRAVDPAAQVLLANPLLGMREMSS